MKKFIKILTIFASVFCITILFAGCEKTEKDISGDSSLKIINKCSFSISIYFDDDFIGKVDDKSNRTWSVPSGKHEVRASGSGKSVTKRPTFYAGRTTVMTISVSTIRSGENTISIMATDQIE